MKKNYFKPAISIIEVEAGAIMAGSSVTEGSNSASVDVTDNNTFMGSGTVDGAQYRTGGIWSE